MLGDGQVLHLAVASCLAGPLLYAATSKLMDPTRFAAAIPRFGLSFLAPSSRSAWIVGSLELVVGAALVLVPNAATAILGGIFYGLFSVVLARALLRGASGDCGCFGALAGAIDRRSVLRNSALTLAAGVVAYARGTGLLPSYDERTAALALVVITLGAAAMDTFIDVRRSAA